MLARLMEEAGCCYGQLQIKLEDLAELLRQGRVEDVAALTAELDVLFAQAQQVDLKIRQELRASPEQLTAQRVRIYIQQMENVKKQFDVLIPQIQDIKSLIASDILQLREGRAAVGGYKSKTDHRGGTIKGTY